MDVQKIKTIVFDGRFLSLSHAGIGRYSCELLKNILPIDKDNKYIILTLPDTEFDKDLSKILFERKKELLEIIEFPAKHYSLAEQTKLLFLLNKIKPDLIHFPHFNHPILYKGKFIVTIHDLTLSQYSERGDVLKRLVYQKVISSAAHNSQKILTVSDYVRREIAKEFDLPEEKIITTYNGIDNKFRKITDLNLLKKVEKYNLYKPYILSVGQWRSHKNLPRLVEAFSVICTDSKYDDYDLVFVGRKDDKYPELYNAIESHPEIKSRIKFTGFVQDEDLPAIYNKASVFVFPSLSEGFGLPGLEAQACGVPVVSSERTCMKEIYGDGALYFDPTDIGQIAKSIINVLADKKLADDLREKGFHNAKRFPWSATGHKTLEVYTELLYK